jgi:hypothetical protein
MRRLSIFIAMGCACAVFGLAMGPSLAAAASPATAWQIKQGVDPSILPPESTGVAEYHLLITNVGGVNSPADVTVTDLVPAGAEPGAPGPGMPPGAPEATFASTPISEALEEESSWPCTTSNQTVTCQINRTVRAGEQIDVYIPVNVDAEPPATLSNQVSVSSPGSPPAVNSIQSRTGTEAATFSFSEGPLGLSGSAFDERGGTPLSGSHPFVVELSSRVTTAIGESGMRARDPLHSLQLSLPAGLVANPLAAKARCPLTLIQEAVKNPLTACPRTSQVGVVHFTILRANGLERVVVPLIDMVPPPGVPAEFAFVLQSTIVHIQGGLGSNFHLTAGSSELLAKFPIPGVKVDLWGVPSDHRHDRQRGGAGVEFRCGGEEVCEIEPSPVPFLTMPTSCSESLTLGASAVGWLGSSTVGSAAFEALEGEPAKISGCNQLQFEPTIKSQSSTSVAESAAGLDFSIHQPQNETVEGRATAALKDASVTLPLGMTLNPSAANGLGSCTETQMGYRPEEGKIRFQTTPQACPNAAKVGTLEARTPLLEQVLPGSIYVAKPFDNPFGSLLAIYLAIEDEETGIIAKLAGKVEPDPKTGQLTARFTENPELPLEDVNLHFFNGDRGALTTPLTCGTSTTTSTLTPWSTPEGADAHPSDSFQISAGCSSSEGAAPKTVNFTAGTVTPLSGAYSPFVLRIARPDGSQHITGIDTTLPGGLLGKLAGIAYCPESGIAQAKSREAPEKGKLEQAAPSCPQSSEVGTVQVAAGSGNTPIPVSGHAYLAGPYKGAPLSLVVIVPAVAGPFDLGTVVSRVALNVGEYDARIHAVSDPLPTILDGIPLDVRSIEIKLDRPSFTLNPTSCEVMAIEGSVTTQAGQSAPLKNRFQVGECGRLGFKPKLALSLKGPTKRTGHPALKAVVTYPKKGAYANIARAQVALPHSEFLDQNNIGKSCTKPLLAARACPARSIYGKAKAWTPLLDKPLQGPVYLVGGYGYKLPALVAELNGQIRVLLVGKVDTGKQKGIRNTFEAVPDAPVERFVLELKGGKKYGLLVNSENICKKAQKAGVALRAQNGRVDQFTVKIANSCKKPKKAKKHPHHKKKK